MIRFPWQTLTHVLHEWYSFFSSFPSRFFPSQIYSSFSFSPRTVPHASYFALNRRDASAIVMYGVQVSRAIRAADHVDVGDVSRAPSRVRFFYNPARWQWRQRLPNDPSFLSRGFSVFFFFFAARKTKNHEERRLMTGKTSLAISIVHFARSFFLPAGRYCYHFYKPNSLPPKDADSVRVFNGIIFKKITV